MKEIPVIVKGKIVHTRGAYFPKPKIKRIIYSRNYSKYLDKNGNYSKTLHKNFINQRAVMASTNAKKRMKAELFEKLGKKCKNCGIEDERVLMFNHIDPSKKIRKYFKSGLIKAGAAAYRTYLKELDNLEVLCANCHRIITLEQWHSGKIKVNRVKQ